MCFNVWYKGEAGEWRRRLSAATCFGKMRLHIQEGTRQAKVVMSQDADYVVFHTCSDRIVGYITQLQLNICLVGWLFEQTCGVLLIISPLASIVYCQHFTIINNSNLPA